LAIVTFPCPPGDPSLGVNVALIDPVTGNALPEQAIVPCDNRDWEVNQLCDYDTETGALIASFTQIFEWDEATGSLIITLVRSDDPTIIYVPTGLVRACNTPRVDIEITEFCYEAQPDQLQGWQAWTFTDGLYTGSVYYALDGAVLVDPVAVQCVGLTIDIEITDFCYESGPNVFQGTEERKFVGGVYVSSIYKDIDGAVLVAPVAAECTEVTIDIEIVRFCYDVAGEILEGTEERKFIGGIYDSSIYKDVDGNVLVSPVPAPCVNQSVIVDIEGSPFATVGRLSNINNTTEQCIPANPQRRQLILQVEGGGSMYVKMGSGVTSTSYTYVIPANGALELPHPQIYTGIVCILKVSGGSNDVQWTEVYF